MASPFLLSFFQAEDGIRDYKVTGVQTCALPISPTRWLATRKKVLDWRCGRSAKDPRDNGIMTWYRPLFRFATVRPRARQSDMAKPAICAREPSLPQPDFRGAWTLTSTARAEERSREETARPTAREDPGFYNA